MTFSLEELISANENGSLESLLLGQGMLPLDVLKSVLAEVQVEFDGIKDDMDVLLEQIGEFYYD